MSFKQNYSHFQTFFLETKSPNLKLGRFLPALNCDFFGIIFLDCAGKQENLLLSEKSRVSCGIYIRFIKVKRRVGINSEQTGPH